MMDPKIVSQINSIRSGCCHFGIAEDKLIGDRCKDIGDNDTWTTDMHLVTCGTCKSMASQVLRWAMRNPDRLPKYARSHDLTVAF